MKNHVKSVVVMLAFTMALVMSILADPIYQPKADMAEIETQTTEYGTTLNNQLTAGISRVQYEYLHDIGLSAISTLELEKVNKNIVASGDNVDESIVTEGDNVTTEPVIEYVETDQYLYAQSSLYIRTGPGAEYPECGLFNVNDVAHVTGLKDGSEWVRIEYNGMEAFVHSGYLSTERKTETYLGRFKITAYCACVHCCGKTDGITASGARATAGRTVAMYGLPLGTKLKINGQIYVVEDRGTPYGHIDMYFDTHEQAIQFGVQYADVYIME